MEEITDDDFIITTCNKCGNRIGMLDDCSAATTYIIYRCRNCKQLYVTSKIGKLPKYFFNNEEYIIIDECAEPIILRKAWKKQDGEKDIELINLKQI